MMRHFVRLVMHCLVLAKRFTYEIVSHQHKMVFVYTRAKANQSLQRSVKTVSHAQRCKTMNATLNITNTWISVEAGDYCRCHNYV